VIRRATFAECRHARDWSIHCSNCDKALTPLLVPTRFAGLIENEYLALLGALSVLVGLAQASAAESVG
jgi:hypothetical protein